MELPSTSELSNLPLETVWKILVNVPPENMDSVCRTNSIFKEICIDPKFWRYKIRENFPDMIPIPANEPKAEYFRLAAIDLRKYINSKNPQIKTLELEITELDKKILQKRQQIDQIQEKDEIEKVKLEKKLYAWNEKYEYNFEPKYQLLVDDTLYRIVNQNPTGTVKYLLENVKRGSLPENLYNHELIEVTNIDYPPESKFIYVFQDSQRQLRYESSDAPDIPNELIMDLKYFELNPKEYQKIYNIE